MSGGAALLVAAGLVIVVLALADIFCSLVRTPIRAGPFTTAAELVVCRGLYRLFRRSGWRGFLAAIGPLSVASRALGVLVALFTGWSMVLFADPAWVVVSKTGEPADTWQRLYYVGYSISTLGLGDIVPDAVPARLATVGAAISGFTVITFAVGSISPLSNVVAARNAVCTVMRGHAAALHAGATREDALDAALDLVVQPLVSVADALETLPVRHRMHAEREHMALSLALSDLERAIAETGEGSDMRAATARLATDRILELLSEDWLALPDDLPTRADAARRRAALDAFVRADRLEVAERG